MPKIPLPLIFSPSIDESALPDMVGAYGINCYVDKIGESSILCKTTGLQRIPGIDTVSSRVDGLFWWDQQEMAIIVVNGRIYKKTGLLEAVVDITGDPLTSIGPVTFATNGWCIFMASGGRIVTYWLANLPSTSPGINSFLGSTKIINVAFDYYINGEKYSKEALPSGTSIYTNVLSIGTTKSLVANTDFTYYLPDEDGKQIKHSKSEVASGTGQGKILTIGSIKSKIAVDPFDYVMGTKKYTAAANTGVIFNPCHLFMAQLKAYVAHETFDYHINGKKYTTSADYIGITPGNDVVPDGKYGAVAFDIDIFGTITTIEATANATGYNTAALAVAGLPTKGTDLYRIGWVTAMKTGGAFTFGTTELNAENTTVEFTSPGILHIGTDRKKVGLEDISYYIVSKYSKKAITDGVISSPTVLGLGSTKNLVANESFTYYINGGQYSKAANTVGTAPGNDVIPINKYGSVAFDIDAAGTITVAEATNNATGYSSAALAVAGLPALGADLFRIGRVTVIKTDGSFTFGTTDLDAANVTVYYNTLNTIVPDGKYGAMAIEISAAGVVTTALASDNVTGYTTAALAVAGLPTVSANLHRIGWITCIRVGGNFTFGSSNLDASDVTTEYTVNNTIVPDGKYGAMALEIDADGLVTAIMATDNNTGYTTAALAEAGLPSPDSATGFRFGYLTAMKSGGAFTFGKTLFDAAGVTTAINDITVIASGKYGAMALEVNKNGQLSAVMNDLGQSDGCASAALAVTALPAVAEGWYRIGWVTATKSGDPFEFGVTHFDEANVTTVYTDNNTIPYSEWGAIAFDINSTGEITPVPAIHNTDGFSTETLAIADLPEPDNNLCRIGWVSIIGDLVDFIPGTTSFSADNITANFYNNTLRDNDVTHYLKDEDAPTEVTHVAYIDTYFLANKANSSLFYWCDVNSPRSWSSTSFGNPESRPDGLVAIHIAYREITLFGKETVEVWFNDGVNPFSRIEGALQERGVIAPYSIAQSSGVWIWLDNTRRVVMLEGRSPKLISGAYDDIIRDIVKVDDAMAQVVSIGKQTFYLITFPQVDRTFVFNLTNGTWTEWGDWDSENIKFKSWKGRINCYARTWDAVMLGDKDSGKLYVLKSGIYQNNGESIRTVIRTGQISHGTYDEKISQELILRIKRGSGTVGGDEPVFTIRWRNQDQVWKRERQIGLGKIGDYEIFKHLFRLGTYRTRQYEIVHSDNSNFVLSDMEEKIISRPQVGSGESRGNVNVGV
jgi:hypothetical protein